MKLNDPMLRFPTPPQSSPLIRNFTIFPFVLSTPTFQNATPMTPVTPGQEPLSTEELRELVEASGGGQTNLPPSPEGTTLPPCKLKYVIDICSNFCQYFSFVALLVRGISLLIAPTIPQYIYPN